MSVENLKVGDRVAVITDSSFGRKIRVETVGKVSKAYITLANTNEMFSISTRTGLSKGSDAWHWATIEPLTDDHLTQIEEERVTSEFRGVISKSRLNRLSIESKRRILQVINEEAKALDEDQAANS